MLEFVFKKYSHNPALRWFLLGIALPLIVGGFVLVNLPTTQAEDANLQMWYTFNGNALDASGNGNDGTVNGPTLTADRFGAPNSAYLFDGIDDYIDAGTSDFSLTDQDMQSIDQLHTGERIVNPDFNEFDY